LALAAERLFGKGATAESVKDLQLPANATMRDVYAALIDSDPFRIACGRISASYAW